MTKLEKIKKWQDDNKERVIENRKNGMIKIRKNIRLIHYLGIYKIKIEL